MVNKWDIQFCSLDPVIGSKQRGTRPVIVISNDLTNELLDILTVLSLSTYKPGSRIYPSEVLLESEATGLPNDSVAMCYQIRTISGSRLLRNAGRLSDPDLQEKINEALRIHLEI
jgi:mRNA interferase MazF